MLSWMVDKVRRLRMTDAEYIRWKSEGLLENAEVIRVKAEMEYNFCTREINHWKGRAEPRARVRMMQLAKRIALAKRHLNISGVFRTRVDTMLFNAELGDTVSALTSLEALSSASITEDLLKELYDTTTRIDDTTEIGVNAEILLEGENSGLMSADADYEGVSQMAEAAPSATSRATTMDAMLALTST